MTCKEDFRVGDRAERLHAFVVLNRADETRDAILVAARACFADRGFAGSSTREIARRAGVTQPLIHHYFGTKDALFDAVLEQALNQYEVVQSQQWVLPLGDPLFIARGLVVLFRWLGHNRELARLISWARLEGREMATSRSASIYERVKEQMVAAREAGLLRPELDIDAVIVMIDALFKGYWDRHEFYVRGPVPLHDLLSRIEQTALEALIRGLATPSGTPTLLALLARSSSADD